MRAPIHIIAFLLFSIAAVYITFPLIFHLGSFTTGFGDELLIAWIQNWVLHAIVTQPFTIFDTNIFFPYRNTLAYSDIFITSSLLAFPVKLFVTEPIVTVNFTLISSIILLGFSMYLLCYYLTKDFFAAILAGILVIFSPAVLSHYIHLQMLAIFWVPLAMLFFLMFIKNQRSKYLLLSLVCFLLQIYNSFLPAYFLVFFYCLMVFYQWFYQKKKTLLLFTKKNVSLVILTFLLTIPIVVPYYQISKEFNYKRDIRDAIHLGLQPEDLFYTSIHSRLYEPLRQLPFNQRSQNNEFKPGFLGVVFSILVIGVIFYVVKNFRHNNNFINQFFTISFVGLIISLGPVLHIGRQTIHDPFPIPLPYALFYYLLPGFQGFRNAARWEMLFIIVIAIVVALVLHNVLKKISVKKRVVLYVILLAGVILEFNFPMQFIKISQVKDFPKVYAWLDSTPKETKIIEMPLYNWNMFPYGTLELNRMYYSTIHFRDMVNGGSGFTPPPWEKLAYQLDAAFPSDKSISYLKATGVDYLIVHRQDYDNLHKDKFIINGKIIKNGEEVLRLLQKNKSVHQVKQFNDDYVFIIK